MFTIRPYQGEYVARGREAFRQGLRRIILCAPVAAGKTIIASEIIRQVVANGKRALFLAPARELVSQCADKLTAYGVHHGIIMAGRGYDLAAPVQVSCTPTILSRGLRRKTLDLPPADLLIQDEVHISGPNTKELIRRYPNAYVLGLSASPAKSDGHGLGGPDGFQKIIQAVTRSQLIRDGYIVGTRVFAPYRPDMRTTREERARGEKALDGKGDYRPDFSARRMDKPELVGDIVTQWKRLGEGRPTIAFACSVEHARHVCTEFLKAGIAAAHVDAETPDDKRQQVYEGLADGRVKVMTTFGVGVAGLDIPAVGCIILARPTKSFIVWTQAVGRGSRVYDGPLYVKDKLILLDHAGCWVIHGRPDDDIEWELSPDKKVGDKVEEKNKNSLPQCVCPQCFAIFDAAPRCPNCGRLMEKQRKTGKVKENKSGVLVEIPTDSPHHDVYRDQQLARLWHRCLARASGYDLTVIAAAMQFRNESGGLWPQNVNGLPNVPQTDAEMRRRVRDLYPGYYERRKR